MKRFNISILLILLILTACGGGAARQTKVTDTTSERVVEPKHYGYRVVNTYPHAADAYTQGLEIRDGWLWEGTGQHGQSALWRSRIDQSERTRLAKLPRSEFGEGITLLGDRLYQLTWTSNVCHVYNLTPKVTLLRDHRYLGEGWGLTNDGEKLYLSDGSARISIIDPATFRRERRFTVTLRGEPLTMLNELEWIDGRIWANVYMTSSIVIINPETGIVEGLVNLKGLLPDEERTETTDVLNGIAWDTAARRLYVTGKNWTKLFEIELFEK